MKRKNYLMTLLLVVCPLLLGACSSSDDNEADEVKKGTVTTEELCHKWNVLSVDLTYTELINTGVRVQEKNTVKHTFSGASFHEMTTWLVRNANSGLQDVFWIRLENGNDRHGIHDINDRILKGFEFAEPNKLVGIYQNEEIAMDITRREATWSWKSQKDGTISTSWQNSPNFDNGTITVAKENGKLTLTMQSGVSYDWLSTYTELISFKIEMKFTLENAE